MASIRNIAVALPVRAGHILLLDSKVRVLDEGSPVGWKLISEIDRPVYPAGALELLLRAGRRAD